MKNFNVKHRKNFGHVGVQLTIREQIDLDPKDRLKLAMRESLRECDLSRAQVVDEMNRMATCSGITTGGRGQKVTEAILDKWTAREAAHIIPVRYLTIFCKVTGCLYAIEALLPPGVELVTGEDVAVLRWGRVEMERRRLAKQSRQLAQEAGIE